MTKKLPRKTYNKTVRKLRSIAKDKGLHGHYKLKKADLVALLLEQSPEEILPRASRKERRRTLPIKIIKPSRNGWIWKWRDEKEQAGEKNMLKEWYDWLVDYVPKPIKKTVSKAFSRVKNSILGLYDGAKKTLKGDVEAEAEIENQEEEQVDLTPHEHERALKGAYRS